MSLSRGNSGGPGAVARDRQNTYTLQSSARPQKRLSDPRQSPATLSEVRCERDRAIPKTDDTEASSAYAAPCSGHARISRFPFARAIPLRVNVRTGNRGISRDSTDRNRNEATSVSSSNPLRSYRL